MSRGPACTAATRSPPTSPSPCTGQVRGGGRGPRESRRAPPGARPSCRSPRRRCSPSRPRPPRIGARAAAPRVGARAPAPRLGAPAPVPPWGRMRRGRRRRPRNLRLRDRPAAPRERGRPHRRKHPKVPAVATPASSRPVGNWPPRTGSRPAPGRCPACRPRPGRPVGSFGGFCFFPPTGGLPSRGAAAAAAAAGEPNTIQKRTRSHRQERRRSPWPKRRRGIGRKTALPASPTNPAGGSAVSSDHPRGRRTGPTRRPPRVVHAAPAGGRPRDRQDTLSRSGKRLFCLSTKGRVASGNPPSGGEQF